jgi:hypothetical protein
MGPPTVYPQPRSADRGLPYRRLGSADLGLRTADRLPPSADRGLRTADCLPPTGYCRLPATNPCSVPSATRPT